MKEKRILHLTLHKKWFDLIASGEKTEEYRSLKQYWSKRLVGKSFDEIHFRNGYNPKNSFMRVEWKGLEFDGYRYVILLGKVLEVKP